MGETSTIDFDTFVTTVKEIVEERPEYVYERVYGGCFYFEAGAGEHERGAPSCLLGHAFQRLLDEETLDRVFYDLNDVGVYTVISQLPQFPADAGLDDTGRLHDFASSVQDLQDEGFPWGKALELALAEDARRQ